MRLHRDIRKSLRTVLAGESERHDPKLARQLQLPTATPDPHRRGAPSNSKILTAEGRRGRSRGAEDRFVGTALNWSRSSQRISSAPPLRPPASSAVKILICGGDTRRYDSRGDVG